LSGRVTPMPSIPYTWSQPAKSLEPPQCTHKLNTAVCQHSPISVSPCPSASISLLSSTVLRGLPCIRAAQYDIIYPCLGGTTYLYRNCLMIFPIFMAITTARNSYIMVRRIFFQDVIMNREVKNLLARRIYSFRLIQVTFPK